MLLETASAAETLLPEPLPFIDCTQPLDVIYERTKELTQRLLTLEIPGIGIKKYSNPTLPIPTKMSKDLRFEIVDNRRVEITPQQYVVWCAFTETVKNHSALVFDPHYSDMTKVFTTEPGEVAHFDDECMPPRNSHVIFRLHRNFVGSSIDIFETGTHTEFSKTANDLLQKLPSTCLQPMNAVSAFRSQNEKFTFQENVGDATLFITQSTVNPKILLPSARHLYLSTHLPRRYSIDDILFKVK